MSLQGPIVVIAEHKDPDLVAALATAGAFPIVEACWRDAANAIARIEPAGVVGSAPDNPRQAEALYAAIAAGDLYLPLLALLRTACPRQLPTPCRSRTTPPTSGSSSASPRRSASAPCTRPPCAAPMRSSRRARTFRRCRQAIRSKMRP